MWLYRKNYNAFEWFFRIVKLFCLDCSLSSIIEEQYYLSKHVNIPISDSENMFDHERKAHIKLLIRDKKEEEKAIKDRK